MGSLSALGQLVELHEQTQADAAADEGELRERDRAIAVRGAFSKENKRAQVLAWLSAVREPTVGYKVDRALWLIRMTMIGLGLILGCAAAGGLFHYTGAQPVNVVHVLAVFVGMQLLLLAAWVVMALSAGRGVFDALSLLSPGRLVTLLLRRFDQPVREGFESALGAAKSHTRVFGHVHKWMIIHLTQAFACAFNIAAIVTAVCLVVFTDLAFGWGTTLKADGQTLYDITQILSRPWSGMFPDAAPTRELIDATRIFRLETGQAGDVATSAERFGGWWAFLIACMVFYGLLPRLITLAIARVRLERVARGAVLTTPGVSQLMDRMHSPLVRTQAIESEAVGTSTGEEVSPAKAMTDGAGVIVNWADVEVTDEGAIALCRAHFAEAGDVVLHAGGAREISADRAVVEGIREGKGGVVILVRAFEPPMGEFLDFVGEVRKAIGDGRAINVVPINADGARREMWRKRLGTLGDPWLAVRDVEGEARS